HRSTPPPVTPVDGVAPPRDTPTRWTGGIVQRFRRLGHRGRGAPTYEDFNYIEAVHRLGPQIDALLNGSAGRDGLIAILNRRRFGTFDPWRRPRRWRKGDSGEVDPDRPENLIIAPATAFLKGRRQPRDDSQKDFANVVLLDVSGSVVQRGYRSRKFDQLIDTMVVFCEIHERLKLPYELVAFSDRHTVLRGFDDCHFQSLQIDPTSSYVPKDLSYVVHEMYQAEHAETQEAPCLDRAIADLGEQRGLKTVFMITDGISSDRQALTERLVEIERRNQVVPRNQRLMLLAFGVGLAEDEFRLSYQPRVDDQPIQCSTGQLVRTVEALPTIVCDSVDRRIRTA
ncbi:MAG: vWA domain-containing protein, partial [Chloroflexota bacterium]